MKHPPFLLLAPAGLISIALVSGLLLSGALTSRAVQNPSISLDMITAGNTYDGASNTMVVGTIDNCLETAAPGDNALHVHSTHVIVQNVEDMIGWQLRLNYEGGQMRPLPPDFTPFTDGTTFQDISFVNLPLDGGVHRDLSSASSIPAQAPGSQTALLGSSYLGTQSASVSPDTPAKTVPDDTTYTAATGGVLATLNLQVIAGNTGQALFMDASDDIPNAPGTSVVIFDGVGQSSMNLAEGALGDGFHAEGTACVIPSPTPTVTSTQGPTITPTGPPSSPTRTPTATPTLPATITAPPPAGLHDARAVRLSAPHSVNLAGDGAADGRVAITLKNDSGHMETVGIYLDVLPPAEGGCQPAGRLRQTTITLDPGDRRTLTIDGYPGDPTLGDGDVSFSCADPLAANDLNYTFFLVADVHGDDLFACPPGALPSLSCFSALADDDTDVTDNRRGRVGPIVQFH